MLLLMIRPSEPEVRVMHGNSSSSSGSSRTAGDRRVVVTMTASSPTLSHGDC